MTNSNFQKPVVLIIAGHDPCGGAGIQADMESVAAAGCYPVSVITCLTAQNTQCLAAIIPQNPAAFKKQLQLVMADFEISACKLGVFGDTGLIRAAQAQLRDKPFPIVLDPIIRSGSGTLFSDKAVCETLLSHLSPLSKVVTPNSEEARLLSGADNPEAAAGMLLSSGAENVFITGVHEKTTDVVNRLYLNDGASYKYRWDRLEGEFHGSGCTLSARIAAQLALGCDVPGAVKEAQEFTWNTLKHGLKSGKGQTLPNRFFDLARW